VDPLIVSELPNANSPLPDGGDTTNDMAVPVGTPAIE
jgi:hypothetical protein